MKFVAPLNVPNMLVMFEVSHDSIPVNVVIDTQLENVLLNEVKLDIFNVSVLANFKLIHSANCLPLSVKRKESPHCLIDNIFAALGHEIDAIFFLFFFVLICRTGKIK
jgi:hypothetical protein